MASYFDPQPKSNPKFLYGRDKELDDLIEAVKRLNWVILLGPRRVGKTSLARCAASKLGLRTIVVDSRIERNIVKGLVDALVTSQGLNLQGGASIPHTPFTMNVTYSRSPPGRALDPLLSSVKRVLVLVDEAQWLSNPRGAASAMAHIFDYYYEKVSFIVTGSAVGVMRAIADPGAKSPLFGRAMTTMEVKKWRDPSTSLDFLKEGCKQVKVPFVEDRMRDVVEELDGLPGWLTLFGYHYQKLKDIRKAMQVTKSEAFKIVGEELDNTSKLALGWPRQLKILGAISEKGMRFTSLASELKLSDAALARNLKMLQRLQYVEIDDGRNYKVVDPVVQEFIAARIK